MEFTLEDAEMRAAQDLMGRTAADLVAERRTLDASVGGLLGSGWSGEAAAQYAAAWSRWCEGSDQVLTALHSAGELLGVTRADYGASDDDAVRTTAPLSSRLQERLS